MVYYYAKTTSAPLIWVRSFDSLRQGYYLDIENLRLCDLHHSSIVMGFIQI